METREMIERWQAQMSRPHVVIREVRELGSNMAEMLAITESGYQQICAKNDQLQELVKKLTATLNFVSDDRDNLRAAIMHVREVIKDGAMTGFNCHDGDWAERLFKSQGVTFAALNNQQSASQEKP